MQTVWLHITSYIVSYSYCVCFMMHYACSSYSYATETEVYILHYSPGLVPFLAYESIELMQGTCSCRFCQDILAYEWIRYRVLYSDLESRIIQSFDAYSYICWGQYFNQPLFIAILIFKPQKYELRVLECSVGIRIHTLKIADIGNYPRITGGKRYKTYTPLA